MKMNSATTTIKRVIFNPTFQLILCAAIGLGLGIGLSGHVSKEVVSWVALPGDLFLRALKCIVILMVFTSMIISVVDMIKAGKAFTIGWKTIGLYLLTTVLASVQGLVSVLIFKRWFTAQPGETKDTRPLIEFHCDEDKNLTLRQFPNGTVRCVSTFFVNVTKDVFWFEDINNIFARNAASKIKSDVSLSQTVQDGIFRKMVSTNIMADFTNGNFLAVIVFGIIFGIALVKNRNRAESSTKNEKSEKISNTVFEFVTEANNILVIMITWVIKLTPIAVISLVAGALAGQ
eukprot:Pgem_evm1s5217